MNVDPVTTAGLVTREVRSALRDGAPTRIAVARRTYPTDQDDLWDALTNAERIPRWFMQITGDLRVGGRYQLERNAGGVIERCEKPELLAVTWEYGGEVSWVTVTLTSAPDGTTLELVHEAAVDPTMWDQFGPGAVGVGWDLALMGLGLHVATKDRVDSAEAEAWTLSPPGIEFVRLAATGWADGAVADGDDPAAAREAAERTIAAYTTAPDSDASG